MSQQQYQTNAGKTNKMNCISKSTFFEALFVNSTRFSLKKWLRRRFRPKFRLWGLFGTLSSAKHSRKFKFNIFLFLHFWAFCEYIPIRTRINLGLIHGCFEKSLQKFSFSTFQVTFHQYFPIAQTVRKSKMMLLMFFFVLMMMKTFWMEVIFPNTILNMCMYDGMYVHQRNFTLKKKYQQQHRNNWLYIFKTVPSCHRQPTSEQFVHCTIYYNMMWCEIKCILFLADLSCWQCALHSAFNMYTHVRTHTANCQWVRMSIGSEWAIKPKSTLFGY